MAPLSNNSAATTEADSFPVDQTRAFGKLILFGEHFVVYKVPALVGAVSAYTDCKLEFTAEPGLEVIDNRPAVPHYKEKKYDEGVEAIKLTLAHMGIDPEKRGVKVHSVATSVPFQALVHRQLKWYLLLVL